jgi:hypothetical protein
VRLWSLNTKRRPRVLAGKRLASRLPARTRGRRIGAIRGLGFRKVAQISRWLPRRQNCQSGKLDQHLCQRIFRKSLQNRGHFLAQPAASIAPLNANLFNRRGHVEQACDLAGEELH